MDKEKNAVGFFNYDSSWETKAAEAISRLKKIFGDKAADIQHIGGTAVKKIKSKPVIDIVVGVSDLNEADLLEDKLKTDGFIRDSKNANNESDSKIKRLFFISEYDEVINKNKKTHIIHVVRHNSKLWFDYIIFRDYLNSNENKAREYESLKLSINGKYKYAIPSFIKAKANFINKIISDNFFVMMLGKTVSVKLDRNNPGVYPKYDDEVYPLIGGYVEDFGESSENTKKQDAYVIGVYDYDIPEIFTGRIIAYINLPDGNGTGKSFIVAKEKMIFYKPEIFEAVKFYNVFNKSYKYEIAINCLYEKSCGAVVFTKDTDGNIKFLLVKGRASNSIGFPKGHVEKGESEAETAIREIYEETSLNVVLYSDFKEEYEYTIGGYIQKKIICFLAEFNGSDKHKIRDREIMEQWLAPYEKAYEMLTFGQAKAILKKAYEKIKNNK